MMADASSPGTTGGFELAGAIDLAWRAATLVERLDVARQDDQAGEEPPAADIEAWARAVSPHSRVGFERRLAWDAVDEGRLRRALSLQPPAAAHRDWAAAAWTDWIPRFLRASADCSAQQGTRGWQQQIELFSSPNQPPFVEAWMPLRAAARAALEIRAPRLHTLLAPEALDALERHFVAACAAMGAGALYERFKEARHYEVFVSDLLGGEWAPFFSAFPVLARQLAVLAEQWVGTVAELLERVEADREVIAATFRAPAGLIAAAAPGLSDRHADGRTVIRVTFSSGLRLAYKPRDVRLEAAFHRFLEWLRREGLDCVPRPLRVLDRGTHGWVEWADQAAFATPHAVAEYFRRAGALACVVHLLGGADLHGENVVASEGGPSLVDTEMLLQPVSGGRRGAAGADDEAGDEHLRFPASGESCLATGFISLVQQDAEGRAYDIGGLQHAPARVASPPRREWRNLRSDALHFVTDATVSPALANDVRLRGAVQEPSAFVREICEGFAAAGEFLVAHRPAIAAPGGPLGGFADCRVRVLFRPSDQYGALQRVLATPRYQRRGLDRSFAMETLLRVFAHETARPRLWPLVADERAGLERLDIPRFTLPASDTCITAQDGEAVPGWYALSGLQATRERLSRLSSGEVDFQLAELRAALASPGVALPFQPRARVAEDESAERTALLRRAAEAVGAVVLARAVADRDGGLSWPSCRGRIDLYGGTGGVCLFLSALAACTGDTAWRGAARAALATLQRDAVAAEGEEDAWLGACRGLSSVVYTFSTIGNLLHDPSLIENAIQLALKIPGHAIDHDLVLDVEGGAAGTLLALMALDARRADARLRALASRCLGRVLAAQVAAGPGRGAWPTGGDRRPRPGFAHGAAGIACALERWLAYEHDPAVVAAVGAAWEYERRAFDEAGGAWPAVRGDGSRVVMTAWCHGAPGIGLARACGGGRARDARVLTEIDAAIRLTQAASPARLDHPCCGNLGRAEALLTLGCRTRRTDVAAAGAAVAERVARRVLEAGRYGMRGEGFERGAAAVGFFQGLSGIGYQLLRAAAPAVLPSVLAFEAAPGSCA